MAEYYDEINESNDGAFITIRFDDILPANHEARYIKKFIDTLDITEFHNKYKVGPGQKGRSPKGIKMMLGVILYAIYSRIHSAHQIDKATYTYSDFWIYTHKKRISHDKISDFINIHSEEIQKLFLETIVLAKKNNLLNFEALYQDGFHIKANASIKRSRKSAKLAKYREKVEENLKEVLEKIKASDKAEEDVLKKQKKIEAELKKIEKLKEKLNEKIRLRSSNKLPSDQKRLKENMQINSTDDDSEITKMKDGSYVNGYSKINATDGKADIVVASDMDGHYDEPHKLRKLTKEANENCKGLGKYNRVCADSNFNTLGGCTSMEAEEIELISPTKKHESERKNPDKYKDEIKFEYDEEKQCVKCSGGAILKLKSSSAKVKFGSMRYAFVNETACKNCKLRSKCTKSEYKVVQIDARYPIQQKVLERYKSEEGQRLYKKRMHIAEVFQADLKQNGRFIQFLRRGIAKVKVDSMIHDTVWNLRRIFNTTNGNVVWQT